MTVYEAIFLRSSIRKFRMEALPDRVLEKTVSFYSGLTPLYPGIGTEIGITENIAGKRGLQGLFGVAAPYYLTFYSEKRDHAETNAGYLLEQISLFLLTLGVGSCFLGGTGITGAPKTRNGKTAVISMAFGKPLGRPIRNHTEAKRLRMEELCVFKDRPTRWMTQVLEAARLAPSASNRQPWRFVVVGSRIHIFSRRGGVDRPGKYEELSFGAMFSHIAVASEELWLDVDLIRLENISQKNFKSSQYVLSAIVRTQDPG